MTCLGAMNNRFPGRPRVDEDVGDGLASPDLRHRPGDPCLDSHWRSVADARALVDDIGESRDIDLYEGIDLQLMRRYLQQALFFKTIENHEELQRWRKPGRVDGINHGLFRFFAIDERDRASRLARTPSEGPGRPGKK